jgi:predicted class III extradiol MEMO1 family dioxygenase
LVETDRAFLDEVSQQLPLEDDLFGEEWVHGDEHSLEFAAVMLGYHEKLATAKIAPFAVGGFGKPSKPSAPEDAEPEVARFIVALRDAVAKWEAQGKKVGFIASVDGAHVGTQFGDSTL